MDGIEFLKSKNIDFRVIELAEEPRSAADVERLYGCSLKQVLKTLLFIGEMPVLVVLQGDKRVNIEKLKQITNQSTLRMANPSEVKEITGYSIGGVTPLGVNGIKKIIDSKVFEEETVNIGSGKAIIGIEIKTNDLKEIFDGTIEEISE
jgi:Cys-tRNA(Pro) deacylase